MQNIFPCFVVLVNCLQVAGCLETGHEVTARSQGSLYYYLRGWGKLCLNVANGLGNITLPTEGFIFVL